MARGWLYTGWTSDIGTWLRPAERLLVLLTTLLILVMPVTESLCNWDRFLSGGRDVEFNLLAALLFAAMVLLTMDRAATQSLLDMAMLRWLQTVSRVTIPQGAAQRFQAIAAAFCHRICLLVSPLCPALLVPLRI